MRAHVFRCEVFSQAGSMHTTLCAKNAEAGREVREGKGEEEEGQAGSQEAVTAAV